MSDQRRCMKCGKLLIDEKIPICRRCRLKTRDTSTHVLKFVGGGILALAGGKALIDNANSSSDPSYEDDKEGDEDDG